MLRYILLFLFITVSTATLVEESDMWVTISQYALGVWKYYNSTTILSTIPHS